MSKGILKYRNPNYVEGGSEPKWITLGSSSGGSTGGSGDTGGDNGGGGDGIQYEKVNVSISASNGSSITANVTVNGEMKSVTSGSSVMWEVPYGTEYTIVSDSIDGYGVPEGLTFTAEQEIRNVELSYSVVLMTTIRINQTISDPSAMITRIVDNGGIEAIRANSHRYVGMYDSELKVMNLKQIDDSDGTKYLDGFNADIMTTGVDVWMKLPKFYWKCEEVETDIFNFSVVYGTKPNDTFKEWDGKDLIGAYLGIVAGEKLYSLSGSLPFYEGISHETMTSYAKARGEGYSLVKWKHHCMMAMLFYMQYSNTNSDIMQETEVKSNAAKTGHLNGYCMEDHGSIYGVVFWGLEDWFDTRIEFIDNVVSKSSKILSINEDGIERELQYTYGITYPYKMVLGENLDLIPKEFGATSASGFCDKTYMPNSMDCVLIRGGQYSSSSGDSGISYLSELLKSNSSLEVGGRLCFYGEYVIK